MEILTFELIQHTPIIHFQAGDMGATLRASEVKPKLDKYLIQKLGKEFIESKGWCIPGQPKALDYKLSFKIEEKASIEYYLPISNMGDQKKAKLQEDIDRHNIFKRIQILSPSPYFANEEGVKNERVNWDLVRLAILTRGHIVGEVYTKYEDLRCRLIKHLENFFLLHNFGTRQTKGFGSYSVFSIENKPIPNSRKDIAKKMQENDVVDCLKSRNDDIGYQFRQIWKFHNKIKTGPQGSYSELRCYYHEQSIEWEKPIARRMLNRSEETGTKNFPKRYIRALLGLHQHFEFPNDKNNKEIIKISHESIDRFSSPITYKPIGGIIYLILNDIPDEMFNTKFTFSANAVCDEFVLTPEKDSFDIADFMGFIKDSSLIDVTTLL